MSRLRALSLPKGQQGRLNLSLVKIMMPLLAPSAARRNAIRIPLSINSNRMAAGKGFNSHCQHKKQRKHGPEEDQPRGQQKKQCLDADKGSSSGSALYLSWEKQ